jgi:RNA polymerase sigma factor (sigma-70 family)
MAPSDDSAFPPQQTRLDMTELDQLVRTHAARLASFLRRRVGNPQDVEDLVQDTLLEAVRCIDQFQGQSRPETWLFGIAVNLTRNYYKRAKLRDIYTDADTDDVPSNSADNPADIAEHRERMRRVASAVRELPENSHQLLQYVVQDDLSYEEVAHQLGIPIGTVRSRISRARAFLKRHADGDDGGPSPPLVAVAYERALRLFGGLQAA